MNCPENRFIYNPSPPPTREGRGGEGRGGEGEGRGGQGRAGQGR